MDADGDDSADSRSILAKHHRGQQAAAPMTSLQAL
jgi:hypothetical protein